MRCFVTGHRGYIGPHLVQLLKESGHHVTGCDLGLFDGCEWEELVPPDYELSCDFRSLTERDLEGHDVVCHLAAISNDPMGDLDPDLTYANNRDGTIELARQAKRAGVGRFLFSGSCSVYGKGKKAFLEESDPLNPLTAYAISKIDSESAIGEMADDGFTPAFLRNATAYGHSPNLRIDLVVNNLLTSALSYGEIRIMSDGTPWRPLIHCFDIARAFIAFAEAPRDAIHGQAVNIGANAQNYQVRDVGDMVQQLLPESKVVYTGEVGDDSRDYRVSFDKLNRLIPDFRLEYDLQRGMEELYRKCIDFGFGREHFEGDRFVRMRTLQKRLDLIKPTMDN